MRQTIRHNHHPSEQGVALVVALVFLLMLTLLGVASLSGNASQERMTYAFANYSRAFQAADSALQQGEQWVSYQASHSVIPLTPCAPSCPTGTAPVWGTTADSQLYNYVQGITSDSTLSADSTVSQISATNLATASWWINNGNAAAFTTDYTQNLSRTSGGINLANLVHVDTSTTYFTVEALGRENSLNSLKATPGSILVCDYRITGHSAGNSGTTTSTVQSIYSMYFPSC